MKKLKKWQLFTAAGAAIVVIGNRKCDDVFATQVLLIKQSRKKLQ